MSSPTVLVLGAGINGVAIARELLLNRVNVTVVDAHDLCFGATAYSSRLIHGGLRYLEYREFDLVRESIEERDRLLRLAPEFVRPLEIFIPTSSYTGGLIGSVGKFLGFRWWPGVRGGRRRGKWLVQMGLEMYDLYSGKALPQHRTMKAGAYNTPPVDRRKFSWVCRYFDAQVQYPERFVLSMLHDCRGIAAGLGQQFELHTYCHARLDGGQAHLQPTAAVDAAVPPLPNRVLPARFAPAAIVNATGAWVDRTLARLPQPSRRLIGGTRGTHLFLFHAALREMLHGKGVYVEADDGRPIFILPLGECVLVGTTDEPFEQPPETAVATEADIDYLLRAVRQVFPQADVRASDVNFHGCGVRPLPFVESGSTAAVTRRHIFHRHDDAPLPFWSVIGGKLTTARSLADEAARTVLDALGAPHVADSRERRYPGNESQPAKLSVDWSQLAAQHGLTHESVHHVWSLVGTETPAILGADPADQSRLLPDVQMPERFARWTIRNEWATTLDDLVERRLMLLYHQRLTQRCLRRLAELLVEAGKLTEDQIDAAVEATVSRLHQHFGKLVER